MQCFCEVPHMLYFLSTPFPFKLFYVFENVLKVYMLHVPAMKAFHQYVDQRVEINDLVLFHGLRGTKSGKKIHMREELCLYSG